MRDIVQLWRRIAGADGRPVGLRKPWFDRADALLVGLTVLFGSVGAQAVDPSVVDPNLGVKTVVMGLDQPTSMAFLPTKDILVTDILVLETATGKVRRVLNGAIQSTVLDLPVNSAVERGLLGIALHPDFPGNPGVYLYWTESSTGVDTADLAQVPLLGNRVDRYVWNASTSTLTFDRNLIK